MENIFPVNDWEKWYSKEQKLHIKPRIGFLGSYDIFLCDSILGKYLPLNDGDKKEVKICEIGSGDGKLLKKIADRFNYQPYGIEYAKEGIKQAQDRGINVIEADAFNEAMLQKYEGFFDVVFSYGFIEHIMPPEKAVEAHVRILKKGGYLVIQIPRLRGFNYLKTKLFRPDYLAVHNLNLMEEDALRLVCKSDSVQELFCKNYGTFKLRIPMAEKNMRWYILKAVCSLEYILNPLCRILFKDKGFETTLFSPAVIFIGRKI